MQVPEAHKPLYKSHVVKWYMTLEKASRKTAIQWHQHGSGLYPSCSIEAHFHTREHPTTFKDR